MCLELLLGLLIGGVTLVYVLARSALSDEPAPIRGSGGLAWIPLFVVLVISSFFFNNQKQQPGSGPSQQVVEPLFATEVPSARKKFDFYTSPVSEYEMEFILFSLILPSMGMFGISKLYGDVQKGVLRSSRKRWSFFDNSRIIEMISVEKAPLRFWGTTACHLLVWLIVLSLGLTSLFRLLNFWFGSNG
jgi:hypothetical protein